MREMLLVCNASVWLHRAVPIDEQYGSRHRALNDQPAVPNRLTAQPDSTPPMPQLHVLYADGREMTRTLERSAPVTIGAQSFCEICIPEPEVPALACRIGWNKTAFEVTAATARGVELNGTTVAHALLKPGDVIRVGSVDLTYEKAVPIPVAPPEPSLFEGTVEVVPSEEEIEWPPPKKAAAPAPPKGTLGQVARELQGGRQRPGEQSIAHSPLILSLGIGGAVLLLTAGVFWFLMGRESQQRLFEDAERQLADGKYSQAIELYERFQKEYPRSKQRRAADLAIGQARVRRELAGSAPNWDEARTELDRLIRSERNTPDYKTTLQPIVRDFAEQIALGAAKSAETTADAALLEVSASANEMMERATPVDAPASAAGQQILEATDRARSAITRRLAFEQSLAVMQAALDAKDPIGALAERQALLRKYPVLAKEKPLTPLVEAAVKSALESVTSVDVDRPAVTEQPSPALPSLSLITVARSRTDDTSIGQVVYAVAADSCYAIDSVTGELRWRRSLGGPAVFFPLVIHEPRTSVLMFDRGPRCLLLCDATNGAPLWQQNLPDLPRGDPVLLSGQIYLTLRNSKLVRIDQSTGHLTAEIAFPQPLATGPAINADGSALYVCGERGVIYTLGTHPPECRAVTFTDHAAGSVRIPLLRMGRLWLLADHDQPDSTRLRVFRDGPLTNPLKEEESARIAGGVYDPPAIRGAQLVVPSQGERLAAFAIDDEPGRKPLAPIGAYRVQDGYGGPLHVQLGPDQQFWLSSTAVRGFELAANSIKLHPQLATAGLTTQPLQMLGETLFAGRRSPYSQAVTLANLDREKLTGTWRTVVGARPLLCSGAEPGPVLLITDQGAVWTFSAKRLTTGGFDQRTPAEIEIPPLFDKPLLSRSLHDGRAVLTAATTPPQLWIVEAGGSLGKPVKLPEAVEVAPLSLDAGLVLARPGRLSIQTSGQRIEDWRAPKEDDGPRRWSALVRLSGTRFLAVDDRGTWRRLQVEQGEIPHLSEVGHVALPPLLTEPALCGNLVVLLDESGTLQTIDSQTLDPVEQRQLPGSARGAAAVDADFLLAWTDDKVLGCPAKQLRQGWTTATPGQRWIGQPLAQADRIWLASATGTVVAFDRQNGEQSQTVTCPQSLSGHLLLVEGAVWATAVDGTLYRVSPAVEGSVP